MKSINLKKFKRRTITLKIIFSKEAKSFKKNKISQHSNDL
nr:MAG TPA: hypothetical protein [Caudoviricetes sp.]